MKIDLYHPFKDKCPDLKALFDVDNDAGHVNTVNSFCKSVQKLAEKNKELYDEDKFKGDALEFLAEFLIKLNGGDNRIGILDYKPATLLDLADTGVDGYGIGANGNPATVQVKNRTGDYILTANIDHLANFMVSSQNDFQVRMEDDKNMLIITTGLKVDNRTMDKMLKNKVRVLNREDLRTMLDNYPEFWLSFRESALHSRTQVEVEKRKVIALREHQNACVDYVIAEANQKGKCILPTGAGKTFIQAEIVKRKIKEAFLNNKNPVIKVNSSRILLCFQLFEEYYKYLWSHGIDCRYVNFNSGSADDSFYAQEMRKTGGIYREILSTTSKAEVDIEIEKSRKENIPIIIFSTYHSSEKCDIHPYLTINDEAHNLVSNEFHKSALLETDANFFFTATVRETDSDEELGMNNAKIFDNVIFSISAREMIERGEMVEPHIHIVRSNDIVDSSKIETDYSAKFQSIISAFRAHELQLKKYSYDASAIGPKVLVVCQGQQDLQEFFKLPDLVEFQENNPDVHLYALSSNFGMYFDKVHDQGNVSNVKKFRMIKSLKGLKSSEKAIILHVDMIGEGIDVSGITGVMPFRNCNMSKFIQNVGRAARLHPYDRSRFYSGEISVGDERWIKPFSWIIIPSFVEMGEGFLDRFKDIVHEMRATYGFIPTEHVLIDNVNGIDDDDDIDVVNEKRKKKHHGKSGLEGFEHEFEVEGVDEIDSVEAWIEEQRTSKEASELMDDILEGIEV